MHAVFRMNKLYVVIKYNHSHKVILRTAIKPYVCWPIMKNEQQILYPAWVTGYSKFNNGIVQLYWHCGVHFSQSHFHCSSIFIFRNAGTQVRSRLYVEVRMRWWVSKCRPTPWEVTWFPCDLHVSPSRVTTPFELWVPIKSVCYNRASFLTAFIAFQQTDPISFSWSCCSAGIQ